MSVKIFATYEEAEAEVAQMWGWETHIVATDSEYSPQGWYIMCNEALYLCEDGYVR